MPKNEFLISTLSTRAFLSFRSAPSPPLQHAEDAPFGGASPMKPKPPEEPRASSEGLLDAAENGVADALMVHSPIADWFAYSFCGKCWSLFRSVSSKDRSAVDDRPRQQLEYRLHHGCLAERKQRRS
ncbi:hypothetical protein NL676_026608 [Syzygium grande]|nr:hypothetical protein NL676_026608 [Syzygium grande]